MYHDFNVRILNQHDWQAFKDIRLLALSSTPQVFGSSYAAEKDRTKEEWQSILNGRESCICGGFIDGELIGISAVFSHRDDPLGETAILAMWFLKAEFRGQGLFEWIVQGCIDWVYAQGNYERILVAHRDGNEASRRTNQKFGFNYAGKQPHIWPDGQRADEFFYERRVS